ncbi:MAG: glutaminase, partial [Rhodospirillaceae bacterium]
MPPHNPAPKTDFGRILEEIGGHVRQHFGKGKVASYIPALAAVPGHKFGMSLRTVGGDTWSLGDARERFSIQSMSKVFTLSLALNFEGEALWRRVGREPSGNRFNSLVQLEYEHGIPRNPLINAGALVVCDVLVSHCDNPKQALLDYMRLLSGTPSVSFELDVAASEAETGFNNRALTILLNGHRNIHN